MNQGRHEDPEHEADVEELPPPPSLAAMADPRTLIGPVLLSNGSLLAPPGLNFACAGCLWQTGAIRSFAIADYAQHLVECPHTIICSPTATTTTARAQPRPEPQQVSLDSRFCWLLLLLLYILLYVSFLTDRCAFAGTNLFFASIVHIRILQHAPTKRPE
jgi:hypothetical protein